MQPIARKMAYLPADFVLVLVLVLVIAFLWAGFGDENEDNPASVFESYGVFTPFVSPRQKDTLSIMD
jgi:hypothetical protein